MQLLRLCGTGLALFFLCRPSLERVRLSTAAFWQLTGLALILSFSLSFLTTPTPRYLEPHALQGEALRISLLLLLGFIAARRLGSQALLWGLPVLLSAAWMVLHGFQVLMFNGILPGLEAEAKIYWGLYYLGLGWWAVIILRALATLSPGISLPRRWGLGVVFALFSLAPEVYLESQEFWQLDYQAYYAAQEATSTSLPEVDAETVLFQQPQRLSTALEAIPAGRPGKVDLYLVAFAGHGAQTVFLNEVRHIGQLFIERFGVSTRALILANHPSTVDELPLATITNLQVALPAVAGRMDPEDILFLFFTSHGSEDHQLDVSLPGVPLNDLPATTLATLLADTPVENKVVVVSACYSGGFIEPLANPQTLVITAARADRTSFGCSDDAEFTYFGRAFLVEALEQTDSFVHAFEMARQRVGEWEEAQGFTPSEPQIHRSPVVEAKLMDWRQQNQRLSSLSRQPHP